MKKAVAGSEYWPKCPYHHIQMNQCWYKGEMWYECYETRLGKCCHHKEYGA